MESLITSSIAVAVAYLAAVATLAIVSALRAGGRREDKGEDHDALAASRFTIPVSIIVPVGSGTALYGNWNGFGTTSWNVLGSYTRLVSSRMVNEVRLIRRQARRGIYDLAIAAARVGSKDRERELHSSVPPSSKADSSRKLAPRCGIG